MNDEMRTAEKTAPCCWICGARAWKPFKQSTLTGAVSPGDFQITDARYGHTGHIEECRACGFKQCFDFASVVEYYERLDDPGYDEGRAQRALQARKILQTIQRFKASGRLLDIGAASGILLEEAATLGFDAVGVEPSFELARRANERGLKVHPGTFPHREVTGVFDVVTLVDVIEHVPNPVALLRDTAAQLAPDGVGVICTPNVESLAARVLGRRWWHFRVAHIGYFSRSTLLRSLEAAGLESLHISSPPWYFPLDYAATRVMSYMPGALHFKLPGSAKRATVRVNFHDSLQVLFRRKGDRG